jgi:Arc/MetJ-type ribon-helix-helix transcriptional regulator
MKRETITISVGPEMKKYILRRASAEFNSVSQYIRKLVRSDNYFQREVTKARNIAAGKVSRAPIPWGNAPSRRP